MRRLLALAIALALLASAGPVHAATLKVGSKRFTESYILAEIIVKLARQAGIDAVHEQGLGGTAVTYRALEDGAVDLYPEYTGTVAQTIVKDANADDAAMRAWLAPHRIVMSPSLGFQNTYALAVSKGAVEREHVAKLSELQAHPALRYAMSHEFLGRGDGWPGLARRYGIAVVPTAIDHALAYQALAEGTVDVTDVYTTDAKIERFGLTVLEDDRSFFPPYDAVFLYRDDALGRFPALAGVLARLNGTIDAATMRKLNARAELDKVQLSRVAGEWLGEAQGDAAPVSFVGGLVASIVRHGPRHLALVLGSLALSMVFGIPLGIAAYVWRRPGALILGITGVVQTIPSLALFCFFIPLLGIGPVPALAALFLYGLLPIVRNTHAGLASIPGDLRDAAHALGLSATERLRHVEVPLASRTILAGVKTSAVVAVGSATIAAFIGAGGFGEPISTGLSLNDVTTILQGALPAAGLALVVQLVFEAVERVLVPRGLRLGE